jgi:group I intron endonuclease
MYIGYIYKTVNLLNGRVYIGKKSKPEFDKNYYGSGIALRQAIKKYGKENFEVSVIKWATTIQELNQFEIELIALYETESHCYNIAKGGDGGDTTSTHPNKSQIVEKRTKGLKNWYSSLSDEEKLAHNKKISQSKKGKSNGHTGFTHREDTLEKMRKSAQSRENTDEWKRAHAEAMARRKGKSFTQKYKPVIVNGIEYESVHHAQQSLDISDATYYRWIKENKLEVIKK